MSLKMKMLRESKKITKTELADSLDVTFRTITNWEKVDGVMPPLPTMKRIANAIGTTTNDVFCCFVFKPDEIPGNEGFKFNDHTSDIAEHFMARSHPLQLFKYIKEFRLLGTGFVIYKYKIFRYKLLTIHEVAPKDESIDSILMQFMLPSDGVVAIDENANSLILSKDNVSSWRIVSNEVTNIGLENEATHVVFEIEMTAAIFPEMDEDIRQNGKGIIYLDVYRISREEYLPFNVLEPLVVREDIDNVIGLYLQICRKRIGLNQTQLAQKLQEYRLQITNGTINRWEKGSLLPGARQLAFMCAFFQVDVEKLLDAYHNEYYVSNAIDAVDRCYNLGLHHSFWNATDYNGLRHFLDNYVFFNLTAYNTPLLIGHCAFSKQEEDILSIDTTEQAIVLKLVGGNTIEVSSNDLQQIIPISLHMSTFYEFEGKVKDKEFSLFLGYNFPRNLFEQDE